MVVLSNSLCLKAHPLEASKIDPWFQEIKEIYQIDDDKYGDILTAGTEAIVNAISYSNNENNPEKVVIINFNYQVDIQVAENKICNVLTIAVQDQGDEKFDFDNVPDPTAPENIENPGGRGIFWIKALSDDYKFTNNDIGNRVSMTFNLPRANSN